MPGNPLEIQESPKLGVIEPPMGMNAAPTLQRSTSRAAGRTSLADALFGGTQQRVLGLLFGRPERSFYANELIALTGSGSDAVQRKLARSLRFASTGRIRGDPQ